MKVISLETLASLIEYHGLDAFLIDLMAALRRDFARWDEFTKMPRPAMHVPDGVIELMPICDHEFYTYKYVNGHPKNPLLGKQTVIATGQLSSVKDGYPLLVSEMTLLTALRTAATSALATDLLARKNAKVAAIIGTGAQSEFQLQALQLVRDITEVRYYDIDPKAMEKFGRNTRDKNIKLVAAPNAQAAVEGADIITVCTACKQHIDVIKDAWIKEGVHLNGLGGDCPGKTELEQSLLERCLIVVEYFDQSFIEGEIQRFSKAAAKKRVHAELHQIITGAKPGRTSDNQITLFDSVGIALEDYSALRLAYSLTEKYDVGEPLTLVPELTDPKDLVSVLQTVR